ncbi:hypothetical protein [Nocardia sp. NPDC051570]|uniref:phage upper tail fiber protein n=1 Tax=Nocardia sp. NPDC051570 TaxID=3364324 RepID=UPI00378F3880
MTDLIGSGPDVPHLGNYTPPQGGILIPSPGPTGPPGPQGGQGLPGPQGDNLRIDGHVPTYADLPPSAPEGAVWLAAGKLYRRGGSAWPAESRGAPFQGPAGPVGQRGEQGIQGIQGVKGEPGPSDWANLTNKPSTFPPASHTHPISEVANLQTALDSKESITAKGVARGYAPLDDTGLVPSVHLPSYVDSVKEYPNLAAFPATGATGKIYVADDTGKIYRWGESQYFEISPSPGSTDAVPEGASNRYYTDARVQAKVNSMVGTTAGFLTAGNDSRLTDQRTPMDGSVTNTKIPAGANIDLAKLATGYVKGTDKNGARTLTTWVGSESEYAAISPKDANTLYFRTA